MRKKVQPVRSSPVDEPSVLDEMLDDANERREQVRELATACGRTVQLREGSATVVELRAPDGRLEVSIRLGEQGPEVTVAAAALRVQTQGAVSVDCETLDLRARTSASLRCDRGNVEVDAGDDVVVTGERVRLN